MQTGGLQNYLNSSQKPVSGTRSATGKVIATILSILILVGGVITGVFLVQKQQEIREKASEQECQQSANCFIIDNPEDNGSYKINGIIYDVYLTNENADIFSAGTTEDGCYKTVIQGDTLGWERIGPDSECENLVNIQVWMIELPQEPPDPVVSQCRNINVYDSEWNQLTSNELSQLTKGDVIRFTVSSSTTAGSIDQARFIINDVTREPTNLRKPTTNEFYMEHVITEEAEQLEVKVELYHSTFGWF